MILNGQCGNSSTHTKGITMDIGFTGTRNGMTLRQMETFGRLLKTLATEFPGFRFHHGDCKGADKEAAEIASALGCYVICHPPIDETHRAFTKCNREYREPKTHFARNRNIVNESRFIIGTPPYFGDITKDTRGGTAYTVMYARQKKKTALVIVPDGAVDGQLTEADKVD